VEIIERLKHTARQIKIDIVALMHAMKDSRTPWYAKVFVGFIIGYALSPIDLIPDFIPIIGYLDDLILLPIAIVLAIKLIPQEAMSDARLHAQHSKPNNTSLAWLAALVIIAIWLLISALVLKWFMTL